MVVTNGTRLNNRVRMDINLALKNCVEVFIITDLYESGDLLANRIIQEYPFLRRILLKKERCVCYRKKKMKVGVEHAHDDYLKEIFNQWGII